MGTAARFDLTGRVALVTGGGGGLGSAACLALAEAGAAVAVVARSESACAAVAARIAATGGRAIAATADVTDADSVGAMAAQVTEALGPIDILVNNAGITSSKTLLDIEVEEWDRVIDVSLKGAFLCTRAIAPAMMARGRGRIINMGSILSERGLGRRAAYCAAKAGLANFTRAAAIELGPSGVTVNALAPTVIVTDFNRMLVRTQPELYRAIVERTPLGRLGETADLEGALIFLASAAAGFITGQILHVDGGYTAS